MTVLDLCKKNTWIIYLTGLFVLSLVSVCNGGMPEKSKTFEPVYAASLRRDNLKIKEILDFANFAGTRSAKAEWREIGLLDSVSLALEKNLTILQARGNKEIAEAAAREARAIFDPVFKFSLSNILYNVNDRNESTIKWKKNTVTYGNDANPFYVILPDTSPVAYIKFDKERKAGYYVTEVEASKNGVGKADQWRTYYSYLSKNLSWGADLNVSLGSLEKEVYWVNREDSWGSYDLPWKSTFSESLVMPLPGTKNFGPNSSDEYMEKEAELDQETSFWHARAIVNDVLLQVGLAYWDLVGSIYAIDAIAQHQNVLRFVLSRTQSLYDQRMATEYDLALVKSEMGSTSQRLKSASNKFLNFSNRINELLSNGEPVIYLPMGFDKYLQDDFAAEDYEKALARHPAIMKQAVILKAARLTENHSSVLAKPDVKFSQSLVLTQINSIYGFENIGESLGNVLINPDLIRQNYGIRYNYPIANRWAKSSFSKSSLNTEKQNVLFEFMSNKIRREVKDAAINLDSIDKRLAILEKVLKLSELSYDKALERQESRDVTEYELLIKSSDLLEANLSLDQLIIEKRKSQVKLLGSLGGLAKYYAGKNKNE